MPRTKVLSPITPRRRLRVAHITLGLDVGGQEKLLVEFARHADRARFQLFFLSLTTRGRLAEEIESEGWQVLALGAPAGFRPQLSCSIARRLRRWNVDVVHTHDIRPLIYGAPAARMVGARRVIHMRHFATLPYLTARQNWLGKLAGRMTDDYVCVSQESRRAAAQEGVPERKLRMIWNGIDLERFSFSGPQADGPAVLVARLSPEKDVATLLRAMALVVNQEPTFRLEIAGDGPCASELRQLAAALGLSNAIQFLGEIQDVPGLLARARMFVLSSLTEGISLTLLEAMARGLPIVATRVGGNPEVVADGITGTLVSPGDHEALGRAMLELFRNTEHGRMRGQAGRLRAQEHFDIRQMIPRYEALYLTRSRSVLQRQT
jgi:glycosyltransferase involved in cell wall biosynthesis